MNPKPSRGLTMLELMAAIAVLAILAALAVPSLNARLERQRLASAAEALATDLTEARFEAAQRGQALHVEPLASDAGWCWAVTTQAGCDCGTPQPCQLRSVQGSSYRGIRLVEARTVRLDPGGTTESATAALFQSSRGDRLRVDLQALGRVRICAAAGNDNRYPRC